MFAPLPRGNVPEGLTVRHGVGVAEFRAHIEGVHRQRSSHKPGPGPEEELDPTMAAKKTSKKAKKGKR